MLSAEAVVAADGDRRVNGTLALRNAQIGTLDEDRLPSPRPLPCCKATSATWRLRR